MKNIETPSKKHLGAIVADLKAGAYVIPDFQREFEWGPGDVNELVRSIFEDFYVGTLLLWRATKENRSFLKCEPLYGHLGESTAEHIVLDGQQRLSALHYAFFAPEKNFPRRKQRYFFFIDIPKLLEGDFEEAFVYDYGKRAAELADHKEKHFRKRWLPLKVFGGSPLDWYKWLEGYEEYWKGKGEEEAGDVRKRLESVISDVLEKYYVSIIELDREITVDKVCDIFTRINNTGIKLDIFDLLNALLRPKGIDIKNRWRVVREKFSRLPKVESGKLTVLQTMSIRLQDYCAPKYLYFLVPGAKKKLREKSGKFRDEILVASSEDFERFWTDAVEGNLESLRMWTNPADFGAVTPNFVPYPTMLPIFTVLNTEKAKPEYVDKRGVEKKLRAWYWASIFTTNYSSSVESRMAQDFREVRAWFRDDKKVPSVVRRFKRTVDTPEFLDKASAGSAIYKGIFCLIARRGAKDFYSWELPEYSQLDDHHIVPRSWGRRNAPENVDSVLNRTPISDDTNRKIISDRLPNEYIREMIERSGLENVYMLFETHLVPREAVDILLSPDFGSEEFERYLRVREGAIRSEILGLLEGLDVEGVDEEEVDVEEAVAEEDYMLAPDTLLFCRSGAADAKANPGTGRKLVVLKGSRAAKSVSPSFAEHNYNKNIRTRLVGNVLEDAGDALLFTEDYEFSSPSAAAAVVLGRSADGQTEWKDGSGMPLYKLLGGVQTEDDDDKQYDRAYWVREVGEESVRMAEELLEKISGALGKHELRYGRSRWIGLNDGEGNEDDFLYFIPQKNYLRVGFYIEKSDEVQKMIDDAGLRSLEYSDEESCYRVRITKEDLEENEGVIDRLMRMAHERSEKEWASQKD